MIIVKRGLKIVLASVLVLLVNIITATPMDDAFALCEEGSWALAREKYDIIAADQSETTENRRKAKLNSVYTKMRQFPYENDATVSQTLQMLIDENSSDRISALCRWRLAEYLCSQIHYNKQRKEYFAYWQNAEKAITELASDCTIDFYKAVIYDNYFGRDINESDDTVYTFWLNAVNQCIKVEKDSTRLADFHLRRAMRGLDYKKISIDEYQRQLRNIATEFKGTEGAMKALELLSRHYLTRNTADSLEKALPILEEIIEEYPDSESAKSARKEHSDILKHEVTFSVEKALLPGEEYALDIAWRNVEKLDIKVIPFDLISVLEKNSSKTLTECPLDISEIKGNDIWNKSLDGSTNLKNHKRTTATITLKQDKIGTYAVCAYDGNHLLHASMLNVTNMSAVQGQSYPSVAYGYRDKATQPSSHSQIWTVNARTGMPRQGVTIYVLLTMNGPNNETQYEIRTTKTDANGLADIQDIIKIDNIRSYDVYAVNEDVAMLTSETMYWGNSLSEKLKGYIYTDRPVYKPGDKVFVKAIFRDIKKSMMYGLHSEIIPTIIVRDSKSNEMHKVTNLKLNDFGTGTFDFVLPEVTPLGRYVIQVGNEQSVEFVVEEYRKPEYEVKVILPSAPAKQNTTVSAEIVGTYYYGAPVVNATVNYTVRRQRQWSLLRHPIGLKSRYSWFDFDKDNQQDRRHNNSGDIIASGNAKTDAQGKCNIEFLAIPSPEEQDDAPWYWQTNTVDDFIIEATIIDASRRNIDGVGRIAIGEKTMSVSVTSEKCVLSPGDTFRGDVNVENLSGVPVAKEGNVYIEKVVWDAGTAKETVTTLTQFTIETLTTGSAEISWLVPANVSGRMRAVFISKDDFDEIITGQCYFDIADSKTGELMIKYQGIEINSDKTVYEVGEIAKILVLSEFKDAVAWWRLDYGDYVKESTVKVLKNRTNLFEMPVTEEMIPGCRLDIVIVQNGNVYTASKKLSVPPTRQIADVKLSFDKETYKPREKGQLKIVTTDYEGNPVSCELSVAIYDKAIEYIAPDVRQDIRRVLYGQNPDLDISLIWSGRMRQWMATSVTSYIYENTNINGSYPLLCLESNSIVTKTFAGMSQERDMASSEHLDVRVDFRDLALWQAMIVTDDKGEASVEVLWPDSLTTWKTSCVAITKDSKVGQVSTETQVKKDITARLSLPPFMRAGDMTTVSAIVSNLGAEEKSVTVKFDAKNIKKESNIADKTISLKPGEEERLDYSVSADIGNGNATFTAQAIVEGDGDAVSADVPLLPYGADIFTGYSGVLEVKGANEVDTSITIPKEIISETAKLTLCLQPSLAMTLRDALPLLLDYPYGCSEQTMNRFVPAAVVSHVFDTLAIPRDPKIEAKLPKVIKAGIEHLKEMQSSDGGWGWWRSSTGERYMTAVVMEGLSMARASDLAVDEEMFNSGKRFIETEIRQMEKMTPKPVSSDLSDFCYMLYVLSLSNNISKYKTALKLCYEQRGTFTAGEMAMLAILCHKANMPKETEVCFRNLENFAIRSDVNGTMHWGNASLYSCWTDPTESTSRVLYAYLVINPNYENASAAMRWLVMNRRGCDWKNTKATGLAVLALSEWMKVKNELSSKINVAAKIADKEFSRKMTQSDIWTADNTIVLKGKDVSNGLVPVSIKASGNGMLFWSLFAEYYTMEKNIASHGNEIFVERTYERLITQPSSDKKSLKTDYVPIKEGELLHSGDEIRCKLTLNSLNNFSYVVVEDYKPACMIPVDVRSGMTWQGVCSNVELRNTHTAFFITNLSQGTHELVYNLRAEMPGVFHAMPAHASAMYVNEVKANSKNDVVKVQDKN